MKWNRLFISIALLLVADGVMADSIFVAQSAESRYDKRMLHYRKQ